MIAVTMDETADDLWPHIGDPFTVAELDRLPGEGRPPSSSTS
jgi:hypothetical protein